MSGEYTAAQKKATDKYLSRHDLYRLVMPAGTKELLSEHTKLTEESVNAFINRAITETISRDQKRLEKGAH